MVYEDFSLDLLKQRFGIKIEEEVDIFSSVPAIPVGDLLHETLREHVPLGLAISTEKARSELIITPILLELIAAQMFNRQRNNPIEAIYGVVTTGSNWKFLRLVDITVVVDLTEYYIREIDRLVGILVHMIRTAAETNRSWPQVDSGV